MRKDSRQIALFIAALLLLPCGAWAERTVVLVTGNSCPVSEISSLEVRKAYLGIRVSVDGQRLTPIRLVGDELLSSIFYQSIVNMSRKSYERRALSLTLKYGTPRATTVRSVADVARMLGEHDCGVAYLWKKDADRLDTIRPVRTLWQGE